jgi:ElaB/YqjD/DUF883 family membrane-anchored ribosome-binding protein
MATASTPHGTTPSLSEKIAEKVGDATEAALNQVRSAASSAAELGDRGRAAAERTQQVAGSFRSALDKSLQDQPRATLAGAAVLGFVIGALWKLSR